MDVQDFQALKNLMNSECRLFREFNLQSKKLFGEKCRCPYFLVGQEALCKPKGIITKLELTKLSQSVGEAFDIESIYLKNDVIWSKITSALS